LPALSEQVPLWSAPVVSGPAYVNCGVHEATPEVASVPLEVNETADRYQPAALGARLGATEVAGDVASTFSVLVVTDVVPPPLVAVHVRVVPVVGSLIRMAGSQPLVEVIGDSGSLTDQCTTMKAPLVLPRYQLLVPWMPSIVYPTTGGESSIALKRASAGPGRNAAAARPKAVYLHTRCTSDPGGEETTRCSP
jgi:hypothetical protein